MLCASTMVFAEREKIVTLRNVRGEFAVAHMYSNITGPEAKQFAQDAAKKRAIEEVCGSRVNAWDKMEISSEGEAFNSLSIIQTDGEIVEFNIKEEGSCQSPDRKEETIYYCVADVKVKKGVDPDPAFAASVNGIKSIYFSNEELHFDVTPYKDCYLKIFLLEDSKKGYQIYPNEYDRATQLVASRKYEITKSDAYSFTITKSTTAAKEVNRLVFVFTKTERAFDAFETSRKEIEEWMARIPNDQKFFYFATFEIRDN